MHSNAQRTMDDAFVSLDEMSEEEQLWYEIYTLKVMASGVLQKMERMFKERTSQDAETARCYCCYVIQDIVQLEGWAAQATRNKFHG